jgi:flagellar basal-body rod modification protein FlgD
MSVMNVKRMTNAFAKGDQGNSLKADDVHSNSATDLQKALGDQNVGDILNKLSDPNWVDPSKKMRTTGDPTLGKDAFMKLMLTQMKYQDPNNPLQSHEMAAQLAQFSSLEQLSNIHGTLESMKNQNAPQTNYQALALIGKRVSGDSSKLNRAVGDTKHGISFELMGDAAAVKVTVKDAGGNVVRKLDFGKMKKGSNTVEWNGLRDDGGAARPGEYRISVEGQNPTGGKIFAKTAFSGRITGLNFTNEGPVLMVGNQSVKLSDVRKIEDASGEEAPAQPLSVGQANPFLKTDAKPGSAPANAAMKPKAAAPLNPTGAQAAKNEKYIDLEENIEPAQEAPEQGNIESVPMARELMASLEKQIK